MTKHMKKGLLALGFASAAATSAQADTVDYKSLRELFGEPVTLSATGSPMRASEVPGSMIILTGDDIRRTGATSIPEILRNVPGVQVSEWTLGYSDVSVRGYNQAYSSRLLVLINGRQVFQSYWSMTQWRNLPVQIGEIEQIEIVKGPNTALFGFNAVGGVINIITKSPMNEPGAQAVVRYGTQDFLQGSGVASWTDGTFGIRASAGYQKFGEYDTPRTSALSGAADDGEVSTLFVDMSYKLAPNHTVGYEGSYYRSDYVHQWPTYYQTLVKYDGYSGRLYYNADTDLGIISSQVYLNSISDPVYNNLWVAQIQDIFKIGTDHTFRLSAEYRYNTMQVTALGSASNLGDLSQEDAAIGGMWSWAITDQLSWTNAVRVDFWTLDRDGPVSLGNVYAVSEFDEDKTEVSINSGLVYRPTDFDTFRLSYGRGVQTPNLIESGGLDYTRILPGPLAIYVGGNPYLDTQVVENYEIGYERKIAEIGGKAGISVFYQQNKDLIFLQNNPSFQPALGGVAQIWFNAGDSDMAGVELTAEGTIGEQFVWDLGYTYIAIDDDLSNGGTGGVYTAYGAYEESSPEHQVNMHLGYAQDAWEADLFGLAWSTHDSLLTTPVSLTTNLSSLVEISAGFDLGARFAYKFDMFTIALEGQHLLQEEQRVTSASEVERRVMLSLTGNF
ncbi:MAG: TonB-dependent receptor [Alphaproteobacteria bacterium]|nr:TonB-dependent receptor [Alphaproteobacteria bacterium]